LDGVWLLERRGYENYAARSEDGMSITCPYPIGSRWWVRETWCPYADEMTKDYCQAHDTWCGEPVKPAVYAADYEKGCPPLDVGGCEKWRSPITMPRWASRITLEVTSTGAGRVQDATENDYKALGIAPDMVDSGGTYPWGEGINVPEYRGPFIVHWNADNPKYPWDSNPWNWVYGVRRVE
jgi:hypothetical protein